MKCERVQQLIVTQLYESLPVQDQSTLLEHLHRCEDCSREFKKMSDVHGILESDEDESVIDHVSLMKVAETANARIARSRRHWRFAAGTAVAASLLLAATHLLPLDVSVDSGGLRVAWDDVAPTAEMDERAVAEAIEEHGERLKDIGLLMRLLIRTNGNDRLQLDRELLALRAEVRDLQQRHQTLQRTLNMLINRPGADDLAIETPSPTQLSGAGR